MRSTGKIAAFWVLMILICLVISCRQGRDLAPADREVKASILMGNKQFSAGEVISFAVISGEENVDVEYCLLFNAALAEYIHCFSTSGNSPPMVVPDHLAQISGLLSIALFSGGQLLDKKSLYIRSLDPDGKIEAYMGPKTLSVDYDEESVLLAFPTDVYHNLAEDSTKVKFVYYGPIPGTYERDLLTTDGYSSIYFGPMNRAGTRHIGASSGTAYMREKELIYVPGVPAEIVVIPGESFPVANGKQFVHLSTLPMKDRYGHDVIDGTYVDFYMEDDQGRRSFLQAMSIGGVAQAEFINPSESGRLAIWAEIPGLTKSNRVEVVFEENISPFEVFFDRQRKVLTIGPVAGKLRALVPDGTEAVVEYRAEGNDYRETLTLIDGMIKVNVEAWPDIALARECTVRIGRITKNIAL